VEAANLGSQSFDIGRVLPENSPWLDEEELFPGQDWQQEIPAAVRACDVVVICLTHRSVSKEGFLQREFRDALSVAEEKPEGRIFVIPVKLEEADVPKCRAQWQWARQTLEMRA